MKKILIFMVCISFNTGFCQIIDFPDLVFKNTLLQSGQNSSIAFDCATMSYYKIDTNDNGEIEESEAQAVCILQVPGFNISDLTGIEKFINLKYLNCGINNLINLNVSQLIHLDQLICSHNHINVLDLTNLPYLKRLLCNNNNISTLNFNNNPQLAIVYCGNNQLSSLDFSNNPLFNDLGCKNNPNLISLNIKNETIQLFGVQTNYNECWSDNPNLTTICADANEISALQTYLAGCGVNTSGITITSNCALGYEQFSVNEVVVYPNPASDNVNINFNSNVNIKTVELIDVQGRILLSKLVNDSNATFDLSSYSNGVYYVKVVGDGGSRIEKLVKK
jgi:Secretion system C-terminal sorting domain